MSNVKDYLDRMIGPPEPEDFDPVTETLSVLRRVADLIDDRHRPRGGMGRDKLDDACPSIRSVYRPMSWERQLIEDHLRRDLCALITRLETLDQAITAFVDDTAHAVGPLGTMFGEGPAEASGPAEDYPRPDDEGAL